MLRRILKLTVLAALLSQALAAAAAPDAYPQLTDEQLAQWKRLIVVAELSPGEYYPKQAQECPKDHACISLNPPPFWLNAKIGATLYGAAPPSPIRISTGSHYGMGQYKEAANTYLVSLRSDGEKFLMPRYANAPLVRDKLGALYLQVTARRALPWLPCEVESLREEVLQENFPSGEALAKDEYLQGLARIAPELFQVDAKRAWPRYAISMERLRNFLLQAGPDIKMSCSPGSPQAKPTK